MEHGSTVTSVTQDLEEGSIRRSGISSDKVGDRPRLPSYWDKQSRNSQWEIMVRAYAHGQKEHCKLLPKNMTPEPRELKVFPTGSCYEGTWDSLGMSGTGKYTFPNGTVYEGEFFDNMFHGRGVLKFEGGVSIKGRWEKGDLKERKLIFDDGLEHEEENWEYCTMPDRRFTIEQMRGFQPGGATYQTARQPTRTIPDGHYDTEDGFYNPDMKVVLNPNDLNEVLRAPCEMEQNWIVENCRKAWDEVIGPRESLYEKWLSPGETVDTTETQRISEESDQPIAAFDRASLFRTSEERSQSKEMSQHSTINNLTECFDI